MDDPADTEEPIDIYDDQPDPEYLRLTEEGMKEAWAQPDAEEARHKVSTPPPDTRTPAQKASQLRDFAGGVFLLGASGPFFQIRDDLQAFQLYLDGYLREAGASGDPVERMLLEQILLGHHAVGRLHFRAGTSKHLEEVSGCLATACRLMAECRKMAQGLEAYRDASVGRKARASKGNPTLKVVTPEEHGEGEEAARKNSRTELGSKNRLNGYMNGSRHAELAHT